MIILETRRLLFRTHQPEDQAEFIKMHTDAEVRRYVGGQAWPLEKAQQRFREQYLGQPAGTFGLWATVLKTENKFIGSCGLRSSENGKEASLAYYLARPYWGRGLATEAANGFIELAFGRLKLIRLLADLQEGNAASLRIIEKFGFRFTHNEVIPANGRAIAHYELLETEWARRFSAEKSHE